MTPFNPSQSFLLEAEELLEQIEQVVLELHDGSNTEAIHHLFRAFHTLKGSGAMFGFETVAEFTHHVETVLDEVRNGAVPVSQHLVDLILASKDYIQTLLQAAQGGPAAATEQGKAIIASLNALLPQVAGAAPVPAPQVAGEAVPAAAAGLQTFGIRFRPEPGLMISGTNPLRLLEELRGLGKCTVQADTSAVPTLEQLQPDQCYLAWDLTLETAKDANAIKDVFIFVEEGSEIAIQPRAVTRTMAEPADSAPPGAPAALPGCAKPTKGRQDAGAPGGRPAGQEATVRVPSDRLDRLVNLVGELVMNQSRLTQVATAANVPNLNGPVEELQRLVAELRDNVLSIRMMPIGTTFSRYKRLVHDLSAELGKHIDLVTEGAETELDKTVLDQLADPLVHLIRNSLDHGIEPAEERARAGKPQHGTIKLRAAHTGAHVVITVQDDGRGLHAEVIRAKAIEKQLIAPDAALSQDEIYNLVFLPGFSTAERVTKVSGRGVGMDVVKRQVEALRGSIQLTSTPGQGTTVSLTLPLTLAIIEGLLVEIDRDQFIIPMSAVTENVDLTRAERKANNGRNVVVVRGELVPYIPLRELFEIRGEGPAIAKVVIVDFHGQRLGLVVDRVAGSHQTVIQSLSRFYRGVELFSGTTIMGDGRVAMIFDLAGIIRQFSRGGAAGPVPAGSYL